MQNVAKLRHFGLEAYQKTGAPSNWLLPVCAATPVLKARLARLRPNHPTNWEVANIDGIPTVCYRFRTGRIRTLNSWRFTSAFATFADDLGTSVVKEFFYQLWLRDTNIRAQARNNWEKHHGGLRAGRFNRGMSTRAAASLSIT